MANIIEDTVKFFLDCQAGGRVLDEQVAPSIFMVPSVFRDLSPSSFNPRVVSIGPLHRQKENLQGFEVQKTAYLYKLMRRVPGTPEERFRYCVDEVSSLIQEIKKSYVLSTDYTDFELGRMMVIDACFIIEFIYSLLSDFSSKRNMLITQSIIYDLLLIENQIPFFVLEKIFECLELSMYGGSLTTHIKVLVQYYKVFQGNLIVPNANGVSRHDHILGFVHKYYQPADAMPTPAMSIQLGETTQPGKSSIPYEPVTAVSIHYGPDTSSSPTYELGESSSPPPPYEPGTSSSIPYEPGTSSIPYEPGTSYKPFEMVAENTSPFEMPEWTTTNIPGEMPESSISIPLAPLISNPKGHSAMELDRAGMNFKPNEDQNWAMAMKVELPMFSWFPWCCCKPTLTMPIMCIDDFTELVLRNLIIYEQSSDVKKYVTAYASAMDMLIDTPQDVALLVKSKVLNNDLGSNENAANMINNICKEVPVSDFFYHQEWEKMDSYYNGCWPNTAAGLKRTYFNNPWNIIALFAAFVLFALTVVQTIYAIKAGNPTSEING